MNLMELGFAILVVAFFLRYVARKAPPMYIGLVKIFDIPWRTISEGPFIKIPLIETVELFSTELQLDDFETVVKTKDHLILRVSGATQYTPDRNLLSAYQKKDETRVNDFANFIKNELSILAGSKGGRDFFARWYATFLLINCVLRLKEIPHEFPRVVRGDLSPDPIPLDQRLDFYDDHGPEIEKLLNKDRKKTRERSKVEETYGIYIWIFHLVKLDFTPEARAALKREERTESSALAIKHAIFQTEHRINLGPSFEQVIDTAEQSLKQPSEKKIRSYAGSNKPT